MSQFTGTLLAFFAGALGALVFELIGFPAAALTGSAVGVTLAGLAGVKTKLEAAGVKFTYPDKKPFIAAAAKVHAAFAAKRGEPYVKLIKAINDAAK